jgi:aspartyl-tRNA synthetase
MMALSDIYKELEERYNYTVDDSEKTDLTTEAERLVGKLSMDKFGSEFMFVTDYPAEKRAFYHMRNSKGVLQGFDLIWRGVEITSGAQREHRYKNICENAKSKGLGKDVAFYLEFFKYGCPPHGGFAIGVDRLIMLMLNVSTVKESELIFRGPNRLAP